MKSHPIPFNSEMVRAILEGRKTMTRRVVNPQPLASWCWTQHKECQNSYTRMCPYGQPGDRLWVREAYYQFGHWEPCPGPRPRTRTGRTRMRFVADREEIRFDAPPAFRKGMHKEDPATPAWHKRLARFMPRKYSRIWLEITDVRVERVQEISVSDSQAEGVCAFSNCDGLFSYIRSFHQLWDSINESRGLGWGANPWVWVVSFKVISTKGNPDGK